MIYLILLTILGVLAFTDYINIDAKHSGFVKKRAIYRNILYVLMIVALIVVAGFRYYTGFDYQNYTSIYQSLSLGTPVPNIEIGYKILNEFLSKFSVGAWSVFLVVAIMTLVLKGIAIKMESEKIFLSLLICFCLYFLIGDMGQIRSTLAQSIDLIALVFYLNGRTVSKIIAFILIVAASFFHVSSIILLIIFILGAKNIPIKMFIGTYIVIAVAGQFLDLKVISEFGQHIGGFLGEKMYAYTTNQLFIEKVGLSSNVIFDFIMMVFLLFIKYKNREKPNKKFNLLFNMYFVGICTYLIFNNYFVLATRFANYFRLSLIFLVPIAISSIKNKKIRILTLMVIIVAFSLMVLSLLKSDGYMYLPYRMDLFGHVIGG
ncbi:MAG: EpsG family protein [Sarcina sp.]